jgi:hypothetical protein
LIVSKEWNPLTLHATVQPLIPPKKFLTNNLPLGQARKLIIDVPVDPRGKIDVYINDTTGLAYLGWTMLLAWKQQSLLQLK